MTTPYAKLLASVNSAAPISGGITAAIGDVITFSGESTVGWTSQRFEITDYPLGFLCPSGWSVDGSSGAYYYAASATPPDVTLDVWGKYMPKLVVNGGVNSAGQQVATLTDTDTALSIPGDSGLLDLGFDEEGQFNAAKMWTGDHKANLRILDTALATGFVALSSATPAAVGTTGSAGVGTTGSRSDHVHALSFTTVNALLATANAVVTINGQDFRCDQVFTGGSLTGTGQLNLPATGSIYGIPSGGGTAATTKLLGWDASTQRL